MKWDLVNPKELPYILLNFKCFCSFEELSLSNELLEVLNTYLFNLLAELDVLYAESKHSPLHLHHWTHGEELSQITIGNVFHSKPVEIPKRPLVKETMISIEILEKIIIEMIHKIENNLKKVPEHSHLLQYGNQQPKERVTFYYDIWISDVIQEQIKTSEKLENLENIENYIVGLKKRLRERKILPHTHMICSNSPFNGGNTEQKFFFQTGFTGVGPAIQTKVFHMNDVTGLNPYKVHSYKSPKNLTELEKILIEAKERKLKITMGGQLHSQGGHQFLNGGIFIDNKSMKRIISFEDQVVTVEPGVSWEELQDFLNEKGYSVCVMQSSNIFTIGGSISVNCHGRDHKYGPLIETLLKVKILLGTGEIKVASREENPDLFSAVVGGFGLLGFILEAQFKVTKNLVYDKSALTMKSEEYPKYFKKIENNENIGLHFARFSLTKNQFLTDVIVVNFQESKEEIPKTLEKENNIELNKFLLGIQRNISFSKEIRWPLEIYSESKHLTITRNNAMRPPVKCLEYSSLTDTDILQEYFVPERGFDDFMEYMRSSVPKHAFTLNNITIRYVKKNQETLLSYSDDNYFSLVLYINFNFQNSDKLKSWTQKTIDQIIKLKGTYYLCYQLFPTKNQFQKCYPRWKDFLKLKEKYDPDEVFSSDFYQTYFK